MSVGSSVLATGKNGIDGTAEVGRAHIPSDNDTGFYPDRNEEILQGFTCEIAWSDTL